MPIRQPFGENMPKGPLQLMISINEQRAVLYSNGVRVAETKVSTGTASHPTPTGVFSIIQKNRCHRSNLYGNAPMFYMHRLTWSGIALHEGHLPGYAASHGCIRMPTDFVSRLWNISNMGMRVVVARPQLAPQEFTHAKLFNPAPKPIDTQRTSEAPVAPEGLRSSLATTGQGPVRLAQAETIATDSGIASGAPGVAATAEVAADKFSRQGAVVHRCGSVGDHSRDARRDRRHDDGRAGTDRRGHRAGRDCCARHDHRGCDHAGGSGCGRERAGHDLDRRSTGRRASAEPGRRDQRA